MVIIRCANSPRTEFREVVISETGPFEEPFLTWFRGDENNLGTLRVKRVPRTTRCRLRARPPQNVQNKRRDSLGGYGHFAARRDMSRRQFVQATNFRQEESRVTSNRCSSPARLRLFRLLTQRRTNPPLY